MTAFIDVPKPIRSGIVVVDSVRGQPERVIVMQFNPDTLQRSLAPQTAGGDSIGVCVLTTGDLLTGHRGAELFLAHLVQ